MKGAILASALLLAPANLASAATVPVTSCPATVPAGVTGIIQSDLDCTDASVTLERGATLDLSGHTVTLIPGNRVTALVVCESNCTVVGPGLLTASALERASVAMAIGAVGTFQDLTIEGAYYGILAIGGRVNVTNTTISAEQGGIAGVRKARLDGVTIAMGPGGYCIGASASEGTRSVVVGQNVTLTSCSDGIWASSKVRLTGLTATNNSGIGVYSAGRLVLRDSTVTGSGVGDLFSRRRPVLIDSTCDTSAVVGDVPTVSWGVCAND